MMILNGLSRNVAVALRLCAFIWPSWVHGGPDVNVAMRASFNSPPYLLELLETAAAENRTAYFPLLDRIADGYFLQTTTEKDLYEKFLELLEHDGHISDAETLASFRFALSLRSAVPRIEAHYQFYNTSVEPLLGRTGDDSCSTWVHFLGRRYCSPKLDDSRGDVVGQKSITERQLDRVLVKGNNLPSSILYTDITEPAFGHFHKILSESARQGKTSYRVRYIPSKAERCQPLIVNGYGVELALKRTDYIVIDDRDTDLEGASNAPPPSDAGEEGKQDLRPLSKSELAQLGFKTAEFILSSDNPLKTFVSVTQDFPKHSSVIASYNVSQNLIQELQENRTISLPPGYNALWVNGIQLDARQVDAHSLLHRLRLERSLVSELKEFGLLGSDAKNLLTNPALVESNVNDEPQRYDYRDVVEGGNVIIWMNNVEKDNRYKAWPSTITALLQRTYPGQLPTVKRDIHNLIVPLDFSNPEDIEIVVEQLQSFVKRSIPIRFGIVPIMKSPAAIEQARTVYYLFDAYGLSSVVAYFEACLKKKRCARPDQTSFELAKEGRSLRRNQEEIALSELLEQDTSRVDGSQRYGRRLGIESSAPPVFINGVALPRNDDWLSPAINRVNLDLRRIQQGVFDEIFQEDTWLPGHFLAKAAAKRNLLVIPEDEASVRFYNLRNLYAGHQGEYEALPRIAGDTKVTKKDWANVLVIGDFDSAKGKDFLKEVLWVRQGDPNLEIVLLHNPVASSRSSGIFNRIREMISGWPDFEVEGDTGILNSAEFWQSTKDLIYSLGVEPGQEYLLLNGRKIGPIDARSSFDQDDFKQLLEYERVKRSRPIHAALSALALSDKIQNHKTSAQLVSVVSLSMTATLSAGIFDTTSISRLNVFEEWSAVYSVLEVGDPITASIHLVLAVDPASETAQRWLPIIKALSELDGVHLKLFMNPRERLEELPIKRFYRYVLHSKPVFDEDGSVKGLSARFSDLPEDALLTVGLDVPASWLVAPKDSVHDLDNIKLNTIKDNQEVYALYELEYILIEGHSRDATTGSPPRGAQLVLGTQKDPHATDTIIMANLGYFQFKANPGFWKMDLLAGKSQEVFEIQSAAASQGYTSEAADESTEIELLDFQGKTLFPRLSRRPGRETDDVLDVAVNEPSFGTNYISKGLKLAEGLFSKLGVARPKEHADINIFSVASGHLYERMLNIMMVSVMKHTDHSVKFWFIEQFLSPSFKDSISDLATEYGFKYEMVTYKWPHWLRSQKEKQREIWGYKILFLDVLFPLSLDKVIFVDADQIVRTDMYDLVTHDLQGAPYGFTPMCDSRTEIEGFRFWKQGYWSTYLRGLPYHISALYVVDLGRFRQIAAGDRLRQQYHQLSADPNSLSNLDQDLPNHMQHTLPIHSLPQEWLWCETWCADEDLASARTIDLCNNPMTKEPKLDRARRQVPEWTVYDEEIKEVLQRRRGGKGAAAVKSTADFTSVDQAFLTSQSQTAMYTKDEL